MHRQPIRRAVVLLALVAAVTALAIPSSAAPPPSFRLGVTHAQASLNPWGDRDAVAAGRQLLAARPGTLQNQHLMGWGGLNPEPSPGVYDWSSLDRRLALIRQTGGTPVVTLCCAPDWMKGGVAGRTDWSRLGVAPRRDHFDDFAALAAEVARRYPDVRHFLVWNELKGFWDSGRNRWRYEDYTDLYNEVYRALKAVDPAIQVGGPYVSMTSWRPGVGGGRDSEVVGPWGMVDQRALDVVTYWLQHAAGADFVAVDGVSSLRDGSFLVDPEASAQKFAAVDAWLRSQTSLPIWWAELHALPFDTSDRYDPAEEAAIWAAAVDAVAGSGAAVALLWQPEGRAPDGGPVPGLPWPEGPPSHTGLWTSTYLEGGGRPTPIHQRLADHLR